MEFRIRNTDNPDIFEAFDLKTNKLLGTLTAEFLLDSIGSGGLRLIRDVADTYEDTILHATFFPRFKRLPCGCLTTDMSNGSACGCWYCKSCNKRGTCTGFVGSFSEYQDAVNGLGIHALDQIEETS